LSAGAVPSKATMNIGANDSVGAALTPRSAL
jgi:hypothetical protein